MNNGTRVSKSKVILHVVAGTFAILLSAAYGSNVAAQSTREVQDVDQPISINGKPAVQNTDKPVRRGADGGTVTVWRPDHTMLVYPGEEGKENGQGGKGPDLNNPGMLVKMTAGKDGVVMRMNGYVAKVRWQDLDKLKNTAGQ